LAAVRRLIAVNDSERQMNALRTVFTNMVNTENRRLRGCLIHANFNGTGGGHDTGDIAADFYPPRIGLFAHQRQLAGRAATETALQTLANYDELTGLANRRQVNYRLTDEVARAAL
jgi:predicted signal transduction protein with EAL and GGDEF domain